MMWSFIAAFCAYLVKGVAGFANTLVFSSIMSFTAANRDISPVDLLLGLPANAYMAWKGRRTVRARIILPLIAALLVGLIPGSLFLSLGDTTALKRLFGVAILVLALEMALRQRPRKTPAKPSNPVILYAIAILSGFLCGLFGIGAFFVAYISRVSEDSEQMRGNLCTVFLVENLARTTLYLYLGILTPAIALQALKLIPAMVLGLFAGLKIAKRLPEKTVRVAILVLLFAMGASILWVNR